MFKQELINIVNKLKNIEEQQQSVTDMVAVLLETIDESEKKYTDCILIMSEKLSKLQKDYDQLKK